MKTPFWQVWIADLEGSRAIPVRERRRVDRALDRALRALLQRHRAQFRLVPEVLRGDELQAVLRPEAPALTLLAYLRARFAAEVGRVPALRAGIGWGGVTRLSPRGAFASEGEAFHRARAALEQAKRGRSSRLTAWITGDEGFDAVAEAVLRLLDGIQRDWTQPQWEAIAGRLEGKSLEAIARERRIKFQAVSRRLLIAKWPDVEHAIRFLERELPRPAPAAARARQPGVRRPAMESAVSKRRG
jgi:hypothetical protein